LNPLPLATSWPPDSYQYRRIPAVQIADSPVGGAGQEDPTRSRRPLKPGGRWRAARPAETSLPALATPERDLGSNPQHLALAAARLAREAIRGQLLRDGWAVLHSSAVVRPDDGATLLTFGGKGAGKTTTALLLASRGWQLLANDRVLVRPTGERDVEVVPWPSAAALGLGLLHSLGWDGKAREHLRNGGSFHPTQHESVTEALLAGDHTPLWENARRERKVQVFPDQFPGLFGVPLATGGLAAGLLFPRIDADAAPDITDGARTLGEADFMSGATEDRYPDVFGQARGVDGGGRESARDEVAARLAQLPHRAVRLSHDIPARAALLSKVADTL
jgi:hypothetical protein